MNRVSIRTYVRRTGERKVRNDIENGQQSFFPDKKTKKFRQIAYDTNTVA